MNDTHYNDTAMFSMECRILDTSYYDRVAVFLNTFVYAVIDDQPGLSNIIAYSHYKMIIYRTWVT